MSVKACAVVLALSALCVVGTVANEYTAIGIDFGLEVSSLAVIRGGRPAVVAAEPTYVSFTEQPNAKAKAGEPVPFLTNVGRQAKATLETAPDNTVYGFRTLLGRAFDHPAVAALKGSGVKYSVQKTADNQPAVQLTVSKQKVAFSAEQLTSMVLQRLKATAEAVLGGVRCKAVCITVPTDFDEPQRAALERAAKASGFITVTLVTDDDAKATALKAIATVALDDAAAVGAVLRANPSYDPAAEHDEL